jgi:hypothetical protein
MIKVPPSRAGGKLSERRAVTPSFSESNGHCIGAYEESGMIVVYDTKVLHRYQIPAGLRLGDSGSLRIPRSLIFHVHSWISLLEQADRLLEGTVTLDMGSSPSGKHRQSLLQVLTGEGMYTWRIKDQRLFPNEFQGGEILSTEDEIQAFVKSAQAGDYHPSAKLKKLKGF